MVEATLLQEILPYCGISDAAELSGGGFSSPAMCVVGVSGGCDSVALLHILHEIANHSNDWHVVVAHFDHQQRGAASDGDREFVVQLCESLQIPVHCYYWSKEHKPENDATDDKLRDSPTFSQDAARQWRRRKMRELLRNELRSRHHDATLFPQVGLLVTAHHKDDSEETLLLKLLRGAHISNLSGLPACAPDEPFDASRETIKQTRLDEPLLFWARPFIHVRKADILQYLHDNNWTWREDASNQSEKYLRNRVRNELVPLLQELVGDADTLSKRLGNLSEQALELRTDLRDRAQKYCDENVTNGCFTLPLSSAHMDLPAKEALHLWLTQQSHGHSFSYEQLQRVTRQICEYPERRIWRLAIGEKWNVCRRGNVLLLQRDKSPDTEMAEPSFSLSWRYLSDDEAANSGELEISLPLVSPVPPYFSKSTAGHDPSCCIVPPWRKHNSPIRVTEFLRGQQVPLHLRSQSPTIVAMFCSKDVNAEETVALVAVHVVSKEKWIIDAKFATDSKPYASAAQRRVAITVDL
jgi:tRNA(Ile)-lysidine synthetase-like protein